MADKTHHLEELIAHQEQRIQDLSDMVAQQWDSIDLLKKQILRLHDKMTAMAENAGSEEDGLSVTEVAALNKPPHY